MRTNQDQIYDEIKALRLNVHDVKKDVVADITTKTDILSKSVSALSMKVSSKQNAGPENSHPLSSKKKLLIVGDSLSRNVKLSVVKNVTDMEIKRVEAFIVDKNDAKARYPDRNFIETVPTELEKDTFSTLVLQGGTNEVSNLDVSGNVGEKIETLKEEIRASSVKLFVLTLGY